ncbi:hypothetical protein DV515_00012207 [Chloebia gouldiae]|uniref:Uncharacterized protein n=1 Tax=Chloebia gouldiae TaxID=44316 RepID=A0A3L8S5I7_CHLGU|nr:hypothetical protein DV515_00012207 [Chloebia gouldiae]
MLACNSKILDIKHCFVTTAEPAPSLADCGPYQQRHCRKPGEEAPVLLGEVLASQDSSVQAGKAEQQESMDRVHGAWKLRWKELAAFERKHHSSLESAFEVAAQTVEESQPQRDLLKESVPLAVPKEQHE